MKIGNFAFLSATLFSFMIPLSMNSAFALSPPWNILQARFQATLEADPCVEVEELDEISPGHFDLDVNVCRDGKAKALSTLLSRNETFGGVVVHIRVFGPYGHLVSPGILPTNVDEAKEVVHRALKGNCYFIGTLKGNPINHFFIEFARAVVQFYADNLADGHNNLNEVAADSFRDVLGLNRFSGIRIGTSTSETLFTGCDCDPAERKKAKQGGRSQEQQHQNVEQILPNPQ